MKKITISIPKDIEERLDKKVVESEFDSVQDYLLHLLKQLVSEESVSSEDIFDEEETKIQEKRLKDLGYL